MPGDHQVLIHIDDEGLTRLGCYLLEAATLPTGEIEAQQFGLSQPSLASAGSVFGAAAFVGVEDDKLRPIAALCEAAIQADGRLASPSGTRPTDWTSWSGAQVLLAILRRPHLVDLLAVRRLRDALIRDFFDSERIGWSFRGDAGDQDHPIFSIYPTLALMAARPILGHDDSSEVALAATNDAVLEALSIPQSPVDSTILLLLATVLQPINSMLPEIVTTARERTEAMLLAKIERDEYPENVVIRQGAQPLWYVSLDRQFSYLITRRIWPLTHPVNIWGVTALVGGFDQVYDGWRADGSGPSESVYSWSTALGLLSTALLRSDIRKGNLDAAQFLSRLEEVQLTKHKYDVVISFSGRQRSIAETIRNRLKSAGYTVFYDNDRRHELLGEDLSIYLQKVYFSQSRYAIAILSEDFVKSDWAGGWEWRAILARMQRQRSAYLLPYFAEPVDVPGLNPTIGYVSATSHDPTQFADIVIDKLRNP